MILPPDSVHDMYICVVQWHEVSYCHTHGRYRVRYSCYISAGRGQQTPSTTCKYLRARESNLAILPPDNSVHVMYICVVQWHEVSHCQTYGRYRVLQYTCYISAGDSRHQVQHASTYMRKRVTSQSCHPIIVCMLCTYVWYIQWHEVSQYNGVQYNEGLHHVYYVVYLPSLYFF